MSLEIVITGIVIPTVGALVWVIKKQTSALEKIGGSLEHLANNVAYCPLNNKLKKEIKEREKNA